MAVKEKHWFKFIPDKWAGDYELQGCTLEAKGMLIELMCAAFPTGYVPTSDAFWTSFRRRLNIRRTKFERIIAELLEHNRIKRDENTSAYYIPRMVQDHTQYEVKSKAGRIGGLKSAQAPAQAPARPRVDIEVEEEVEVEKKEVLNLKRNHMDYITDLYGILPPVQVQEILPLFSQFPDIEKFGALAKKIYDRTKKKYRGKAAWLCGKVFEEYSEPESTSGF